MAELEDDPDVRRAWLTFVVVGGGPTGVEIAGQIAELSRRALKHNFRRFDSGRCASAPIRGRPGDPGHLRRQALRKSDPRAGEESASRSTCSSLVSPPRRGRSGCQSVPDGSVQRYSAKTKIWAAGVSASPLAKMLADATGAECDRSGRIKVRTRLLPAWSSGGVRRWRHDELQRPPRRMPKSPFSPVSTLLTSLGSACQKRR